MRGSISIGDEAREVGSRARRDPRGRDVSCEMWVGCRFAVRVVLLLKRLLSVVSLQHTYDTVQRSAIDEVV